MIHGRFIANEPVDEVMGVYMPEGRSYTGLEQVEIFCHGGAHVVNLILKQLIASGARAAEPGEFTKLAFLSGRIDLSHAEAVAEIISANTEMSYKAAREQLLGHYTEHIEQLRAQLISLLADTEASIDFPEDDINPAQTEKLLEQCRTIIDSLNELLASYDGGRILKEGFKVVIAGRPNAGKSSLFNLLLKNERALVTPTAGTTRDYLSEWIDIEGYAVNLIDTAGLRSGGGAIEKAGQDSARKLIDQADLLIWIFDLSKRSWSSELESDLGKYESRTVLTVANKCDLVSTQHINADRNSFRLSCKTSAGLDELRRAIAEQIKKNIQDMTDGIIVTSARHRDKLSKTVSFLSEALENLEVGGTEYELVAFDIREAINQIDEITGRIYNDEILGQIFSTFCIGK